MTRPIRDRHQRPHGLTIADGFRVGIGISFWLCVGTGLLWVVMMIFAIAVAI